MESEALEYVKNQDWVRALQTYNKLLQKAGNSDEQIIDYLLNRCECLYHLGNYDVIISDCRQLLKTFNGRYENLYDPRTRIYVIRSLLALNRHQEAEMIIRDWLMLVRQTGKLGEFKAVLENFLERFFTITSKQHLEVWLNNLEMKFRETSQIPSISCIYCNLSFRDKSELSLHCTSREHEAMIMSDDGRDWHWRTPPRGIKSYSLCENWRESGHCRFGVQCVEAHGEMELFEWKERFQYREMKMLKAKEKELYGKSYTENLLEKWAQTSNACAIMNDKLEDVEDSCPQRLLTTVSSKTSNHCWNFLLTSTRPLRAVALLQDAHRNHFHISRITEGDTVVEIKNQQEVITSTPLPIESIRRYQVTVAFQTTIFGTFRQSVVFDFGSDPVLVKHLCVDVIPDDDLERINEIRKEVTFSAAERWNSTNSEIVPFASPLVSVGGNTDWERNLKSMYPCPHTENFLLSNSTVSDKKFTRNNYKGRMHELLIVEEIARYNLIAQYNLTTRLQIAHSYLLAPNSMAASTAKYSNSGELFASVSLGKKLSEDTSEGRLILRYCNSVLLLPNPEGAPVHRVYEALIEDKGKDMIYLRLSAETVRDLRLTTDTDLEVQIQFQLNRIPYCEWHYAVDKIRDFKIIFPETYVEPVIPWSPSRQWSPSLDSRLNLKQKEAVVAITTSNNVKLPPTLVIGPFGTGKTFTLAQAVKELIKDERNKILLCTHSNSAADLYIKDYFDVWVEGGEENARPLRIYYQKRWVTTVSPVVQKYCKIKLNGNTREFQVPTLEDIGRHKIIVVTLSTSIYLSSMGLPPDTFTHILLDEAAQALESETITPLALATENTRIVLAGDHMQLGPDIFSKFARDRNLHVSLLERLYDHYPAQFPCKILLCENYRAHEAIIQFTSESFYDQKLISSSKQPRHVKYHPLTFFTTRGEDVQDKNSTAFYNNSEVYEVVERVAELKKNWPEDWGEFTAESIGVVTPYSDQVFRIRSELRKRKIDVCVERVLNVQGKQFRAIILSTVRTRRTCLKSNDSDYGFLSNSKLLNTAITRAQSLVAVVGDPVALCSVGRCSKVWERFIQVCNDSSSLFGITWAELKFQLDGIELKKVYTLNPLAPEFVPRKYKDIRIPKMIPAYPVVPIVYQRSMPLTSPYVLNVQQPIAITNGFRPIMTPREIPLVVAQRQLPMTAVNVIPNNLQANHKQPSNMRLIQFMNNVHFPEAQILSDCVNLLPQQMSLADMLVQPASVQERWYNYLRETAGVDAAEKFKYLLHTTNQKGVRMSEPNVLGRATPCSSSNSPTFNWFDSPFNQINFNKPVYMNQQEGNWPELNKSNPLYKRHSNHSTENDIQRQVNQEFANLNINNGLDSWYDIFRSFSNENQNSELNLAGGRFYKYFS